MSAVPLLDTHAWIWWLSGAGELSRKEREALDGLPESTRPDLCAISLWEAAMLVDLGRIILRMPFDEWIEAAASEQTIDVLEVTTEVAKELVRLPKSFHRDPADRIIVATARILELSVATHDARIRRSGLVRLWRP